MWNQYLANEIPIRGKITVDQKLTALQRKSICKEVNGAKVQREALVRHHMERD